MDTSVAAQCGFCTPGILMAAEAFLTRVGRSVSRDEVAEALAGNLCRCTGYTKIVDAIVEASEQMAGEPV
jgi:aerobic-type carbon monoxide dehydrogenase small subunit (CoxS/CutS family)